MPLCKKKSIEYARMRLPTMLLSRVSTAHAPPPTAELVDASLAPSPDVESLVVGVGVYLVGFAVLTAWKNSWRPASAWAPGTARARGRRQLTKKQRKVPFLTPWTADLPVPPPPYERLQEPFRVGKRDGVKQMIVKSDGEIHAVDGVVEKSDAWSEYYGADVVIYKERDA